MFLSSCYPIRRVGLLQERTNLPEYEIYTGKDQHNYITDHNNKYLKEFLDSIDVDLKVCAKEDYS